MKTSPRPVRTVLRLTVEAIADGDSTLAAAILEQVPPESADNTVAGCIGVVLGLLDDWLTGADPHVPNDLDHCVRLPAGHWLGERAATDVLVLAREGSAFGSLNRLIARRILLIAAPPEVCGVAIVPGRPGVAPWTARLELFARLIARGVPSAEGRRNVGVNPADREALATRAHPSPAASYAAALSIGDR
jgi:hypothetical protein